METKKEGSVGIKVKVNPFSFSYFRALRVTHDGIVVDNMDLAAHKRYFEGAETIDTKGLAFTMHDFAEFSTEFHKQSLNTHLAETYLSNPHNRSLKQQFQNFQKSIESTSVSSAA